VSEPLSIPFIRGLTLRCSATYLFRVRGKSSSVKQRTIGKSEKGPKVTNEKSANGGADQAVPQGGQGEGIADSAAERMQKVI